MAATITNAIVAAGQDKWPHGLDAQQDDVSGSDLKDYLTYKIEEYIFYDFKNCILWETFIDDFKTYTVDTFKVCNQITVRRLRDLLRHKGV